MKIRHVYIALLSCLWSCSQRIPCDQCSLNNLKAVWEVNLKYSNRYYALVKSGDKLYYQDPINNNIELIDSKTGNSSVFLASFAVSGMAASNISLSIKNNTLSYEKIIDERNSLLEIFNLDTRQKKDSIKITTDHSNAPFSSDQKVAFPPLLAGSKILYGLMDGTMQVYEQRSRKRLWTKDFGKVLVEYTPVLIGNDVIVTIRKPGYFHSESNILSLNILSGRLNWCTTRLDLKLPLINLRGFLAGIDNNGWVFSLNPTTGKISKIGQSLNNPICFEGLNSLGFFAISDSEKHLVIWDLNKRSERARYETCSQIYKMKYSEYYRSLFAQDENGNLTSINFDTWKAKCVTGNLNTFSNFVVSNDSLFLNKSLNISLILDKSFFK